METDAATSVATKDDQANAAALQKALKAVKLEDNVVEEKKEVSVISDADIQYRVKKGKCIIFNHKVYNRGMAPTRNGTDEDFKALKKCFQALNFEIHPYEDLEYVEIKTALSKAAKDCDNIDCLVVCVLTHGNEQTLWARDGTYNTEKLFEYFKDGKCPALVNKPKLFFIQACQGEHYDKGCVVKIRQSLDVADSAIFDKTVPWPDFLLVHSAYHGFYSWRSIACGSWFMQTLVEVLNQYAGEFDVQSLVTIMNCSVAYQRESLTNDEDTTGMKQICCVWSTLRQLVYFDRTNL